jgi:hypothetical protein
MVERHTCDGIDMNTFGSMHNEGEDGGDEKQPRVHVAGLSFERVLSCLNGRYKYYATTAPQRRTFLPTCLCVLLRLKERTTWQPYSTVTY